MDLRCCILVEGVSIYWLGPWYILYMNVRFRKERNGLCRMEAVPRANKNNKNNIINMLV